MRTTQLYCPIHGSYWGTVDDHGNPSPCPSCGPPEMPYPRANRSLGR